MCVWGGIVVVQARLSLELQRDSHVKQQRLIEEKWKRSRREAKPRALHAAVASSSDGQRLTHGPQLSASQMAVSPALDPTQVPEHEYDTWLYLLKHKGAPRPAPQICPSASKAVKDDKTRLEEQETTIVQLRGLVDTLMSENERLKRANEELRADNERLRRRERERELERDDDDDDCQPEADDADLWVLPQRQTPGSSALAAVTMTAEERKAKDIAIPQLPPLEMPTQEIPLEDLPGLELPEDIQHVLQEILDGEKL